jgi:hypothetical protein
MLGGGLDNRQSPPGRSQFGVYRGLHHAAAFKEVDQVGGERASGLER